MTHKERAEKWLGPIYGKPPDHEVSSLAEQFREVEREAAEGPSRAAAERVGADPEVRTVLLREFGTTEPELISEAVAQLRAAVGAETKRCHRLTVERLREVVRSGDALRKGGHGRYCQCGLCTGWDAATKGISRE